MTIKPLKKYILAKVVESEKEEIKGGIIIPDAAKEKSQEVEVIDVGEDITFVEAGDFVLITKYSGNEVDCEGVKYTILKEEDIIAKVIK